VAQAEYKFYLPLVYKPPSIIGVQDETRGAYADRYALGSRVHLPVCWKQCHEQGIEIYNKAIEIASIHWTILGIRDTPDEYKLWPDVPCSPPAPAYYQAAAEFFIRAIEYIHPAAVAIYNEPEMIPSQDSLPFMGCWGVDWEGGFRYGSFCQYIYQAIKPVFPDVVVIAGEFARTPSPPFWDGFTIGVGDNYDALSFHDYTWFGQPDRGPEAVVRQLQSECPRLFWTETALLKDGECTPEFLSAQAEHFDQVIRQAHELGIETVFWYTIGGNGWMNSDLLTGGEQAPVYLKYLNKALGAG